MKNTIRKRMFAWGMKSIDEINHKIYHQYKEELIKDIAGLVVEIGPGSGINFRYLPTGVHWIGIEPNQAFHKDIKIKAQEKGIEHQLIQESASRICLADNSADVILSTLVLCSVKDPAGAIAEMKRVLKPGGRLIFIEHVAADRKTALRYSQNLLNPVNRFIADGCNCNRETWKYLETAGFSKLELTHHRVFGSLAIHSPHIMGYAIK